MNPVRREPTVPKRRLTPMRSGTNHLARRAARTFAIAALVGLAAAACGGVGGGSNGNGLGGSPTPASPSPTLGANDLLLRMETKGGFVAPQALLLRFPTFSLYGDGTVITQGAQPAIYPGPALPSLIATRLTPAGVAAVLQEARRAGLYGPSVDYHGVMMPDAGTTVFTLNEPDRSHVISVTALGADPQPGVPAAELAARKRLETFSAKLGDLRSWLPEGSVGPDTPYQPAGLRVFVSEGAPQGNGVTEPSMAWPLSTPLSGFGSPLPTPVQGGPARCGVVTGADLATLLPSVQKATEITPWTSEGTTYTLSFRQLLPDESTC